MDRVTLGCMYNCGDVCKGKCIREKISVIDESEKDLYSEIENLIIFWSNDGTKTAGSLTREIMALIKTKK
jgi:gas vesicle protein